ncbi:MAG: hypothetical protein H6718_32310 [Polyangiaceae bacterium]|nr:hypothetical protein [Myxococcales bacterium]MCB9590142.1 hypothetical protein [Polyangiaceae bacterium]MCB9608021.1 hypothetical protein [Polyangiaceae bacterium]
MTEQRLDSDALLCALVLVPTSFSRNRFYELFEGPGGKRVRKRAKRLRGLIRQLLGRGREQAEIVGRQELDDGSVLMRFRVDNLGFQRTTSLNPLEMSIVNFALHRAGKQELPLEDRERVEGALLRLAPQAIGAGPESFPPESAP